MLYAQISKELKYRTLRLTDSPVKLRFNMGKIPTQGILSDLSKVNMPHSHIQNRPKSFHGKPYFF